MFSCIGAGSHKFYFFKAQFSFHQKHK
jgi:hypothetical protein